MPVPSVATSISFHPSSSYVFSPSLSQLAEPRMVTPTEDLVSQQILSLPPSLTIVDMATLNSLDVHSCRSMCMDCRNVQTLPSQGNLSVTADPVTPASNLIASKSNEFNENVLGVEDKFKPLPLAELYSRTIDCNCNTDVDIKQTSNSSSTSPVKAHESRLLSVMGNETNKSSTCADPLPKSLKIVHEVGYKVNRKSEAGCVDVSKTWDIEDENSEVESPSIQSNIFHENKSKSFLSVNSAQDLHSGNEENVYEEIPSVPFQRGNVNEFYFDKTVSSGNPMYISSDLKLSPTENSLQLHPYVEEETNSSLASCEHSLKSQNIIALSSCISSETSNLAKSNESLCTCQHSDLTFANSASDSLSRSCIGSCSSDEKVLSVYKHSTVNRNIPGCTLIKSPSLQFINSNIIAEFFAPELNVYDLSVTKNAIIKTDGFQHFEMRGRKLEKMFTLVLAEVPAISEQTITFDLSEILQECNNKNLVLEKRAVFDIKLPLLNLIKVTAAENLCNSNDGSFAFNENLASDQVFIKVNPASYSLKQLILWNKIFPMHDKVSSLENTSNGCMSCMIIRLNEQFSIQKAYFGREKPNSKPKYLGFLVSSDFLHSLNISTSPKGSLSISLSSSRPNQKYSTCTSVDVQFNGNNEDSVPVIPLGIYSPNGNSNTDSKWFTSLSNSSHKDMQNLEDIFLTKRDIKTRKINSNVHLRKHIGLGNVHLNKSSKSSHIPKIGAQIKEENIDNICSPELQLVSNALGKSESRICLENFGERDEDIRKDASYSNKTFQYHNGFPNYQSLNNDRRNTEMLHKDVMSQLKHAKNMDHKNSPLSSPIEEELKSNIFIDHTHRNKGLISLTSNQNESYKDQSCSESRHDADDQHTSLKNSFRDLYMKEVDEACWQNISHSQGTRDSFNLFKLKDELKKGKSLNELQKRTKKDQVGLDVLDTNYYSLKKKFQAKRLEGYCKPFKINKVSKNKLGIELKKPKKYPDDEFANIREDLNSKLGPSWKLNHYGNNCLSSLRNFLASTVLDSNGKLFDNDLHGAKERNSGEGHHISYKMENTVTTPQTSKYERFCTRENGRQIIKTKSSDKKVSWNFLLSSSGSTKRSKLTILIFCLAVTSLLISLHALSTDSSLYIKPTFFLVQEDDMATSTSSENPYIDTPHYLSKAQWEHFSGADKPAHGTTEGKEDIKSLNKMGNGVSYVKNLDKSTKWDLENNDANSENVIIGDNNARRNEKMTENEQLLRFMKTPTNALTLNGDAKQNPSILKSTSNIFSAMNVSIKKSEVSTSLDGKYNGISSLSSHDENVLSWIKSKFKSQNENNGKSKIDSIPKESETEFTEMSDSKLENGENIYQSYQPNSGKTIVLSNIENQTKSSLLSNEGTTNSQNEFDLNLAFIEKNELNAAYGIDGGTTGADGNIEDYTGDEDMGVLATTGNRIKFPKATRRLPQALIIGVRKGGTRALLEMLHLHPLIQKAGGEAHFFDRDENYAKGLQWYRRRMPPSLKGQITVEKSPSYFVTPEVPERVRAMNASIRLLLIVREPVTRAISDFAQLRSHSIAAKANATSKTKLDGGGEEDYGKKPTRSLSSFESLAILPDGRVDMSWRPISVSLYHRHISAWLEAFPRDQILIVDGDQLASNPAPVLASVEKFLKLRPALTPTHFYFNATKGFYCLRSLPPGQQVDGMAMLPSSVNHPPSLPEGKCLRESKGRRHPHVDPSVVHKLRRFFAEHNRRFYEMVGEDFGWPEE